MKLNSSRCVQSTITAIREMRPIEEPSLILSSELILKIGKLSVAINNDIPVGYYDSHLINTNTLAPPLKHGDMSCHGMYVR